MLNSTVFVNLRASTLASLVLAALGALAGCTIVVGDNVGAGHDDAWEQCYDQYDDCLDAADGQKVLVDACGKQLDGCTAAADGDPTGGPAGDSAGASAGDSAGASAGDTAGTSAGDTAGSEVPADEICVSLHKACIAGSDSIADTLACEALFDHCAHPGVCPEPCDKGCPEAGFDACLNDYAGCVAGSTKDYEVDACNVVFHGCVDDLGAPECLPADDAHTDECLAEHALCTACAEGDAELAACKDIFDTCISPPM